MNFKPTLNIALGITVEVLYVFTIILAAFLICLAVSFKP